MHLKEKNLFIFFSKAYTVLDNEVRARYVLSMFQWNNDK